MATLWLPETQQSDADRAALADETLLRHLGVGKALARELTALDPLLDCVFISERAPAIDDVVPGRWHIRRKNPAPTPHSYLPIQTPEGGFAEPSMEIVESLKRNDLWNPRNMERLMSGYKREAENRRRKDELDAEQRKDESISLFKAAKRVSGEGGMHRRLHGKGRRPA